MNALSIKNISKKFKDTVVIDNLSLNIPQNIVYGFLGQNGAGKTTTMKMILGLLKVDSGTIEIFNEKVSYGETRTNRYIGYLPDVPEFYSFMTCKEYLKLCGEVSGLSKYEIKDRTDELLNLVGLNKSKKRIGGFSRGMKQRLGIASALLNKPKLLICDEPTSALDPIGRREILEILQKVKKDTTVIFSTHVLSDVEKICDRVGILNKGKIVLEGDIKDLKLKNSKNKYYIQFLTSNEMKLFLDSAKVKKIIIDSDEKDLSVVINSGGEYEAMNLLSSKRIIPVKFEMMEPSLDDIFEEVVG